MGNKPTYEELEQRVKELENKALERYRLEDEVERIFNLSLDMIGSGNLDGYFTKINSSFGSILGYTEDEFLEKPFISFVHDDDLEKTEHALAEAAKGKQNIYIENRYKCKDGSYKWIEWKVLSIVQENKFIAVGRDITTRKQTEAALGDSQHMLHTVLDSIPTAVFWKDRDSCYLGGNRTWLAAAGLNSSEEVVGKSDYELPWDKEQANSFRERDKRVMETGLSEYNIIEPYRKADGTRAWAKTNKVPLRDTAGDIVGVLGTYEDISERKRAEDALRESELRLHQTIAELSAIINTLPGMITVMDLDYNILVANHDVIEKFGHSRPEEVIGKKCYEIRKGRDSVCPECGVKRALENGETFVRLSIPQEENMMGISTKAYASPIKNDKGIVWGAVEVIMDITDLRQAEEESILLATAIEQASESVIIADRVGMIRYVNPAFEQLSGFVREELTDHHFRILKSDKHDEEFYEKMWKIISNGQVWAGRITNRMKDGTLREFETRISPVRDSSGEIINFVSVNRDITHEIALEAQLQQAQRMEAIGTLAGGVAHDLNNILSGIVSYPELILMDLPEGSPLRKPIMTIQKSGEKAAVIVQDLLTLARRGVSISEVLNLNHVISEQLKSPEFKKLISFHSDIQVKTHLEKDLLNIKGSSAHLSKSVMNILSNAAEAMLLGGTITISTANCYLDRPIKGYDRIESGEYVTIRIADTGMGIPEEDAEKIFEPFYTKKVMGRSGTGLGMTVVWGTVKDHKGYIDIQSTVGKGTAFTLYFPVTRKEIAKDKSLLSITDYMGKGELILVIDDVEEQREIANGMLRKLDYSVSSVSSGEEAIKYLKTNSADLLLLDMIMEPGIDGLETYKRIIEMHPRQKAVIASGFSETDDVKAAQRLGAGEYIKKPYTLEKIGIAVKNELKK